MQSRKGFFARMANLFKGIFGTRLESAELSNADAIYHRALRDQETHLEKLKQATSRLVYLRNRTDAQLRKAHEDLNLVSRALMQAAQKDQDDKALKLVKKQRELKEQVMRLEDDFQRLQRQADQAKESLTKVDASIERIKKERIAVLARKDHAQAQLDAKVALEELVVPATSTSLQALEQVRQSVAQLEHEAGLDSATGEEVSIDSLRQEESDEQDKKDLEELKTRIRRQLDGPSVITVPVEFDAKPVEVV